MNIIYKLMVKYYYYKINIISNYIYIYIYKDILETDPITGEKTYKTYTNPSTGETFTPYWSNTCTYDELPYRCPNGKYLI